MAQDPDSFTKARGFIKAAFKMPVTLKKRYRSRFKALFTAIDLVHSVPILEAISLYVSNNKANSGQYHKHGGTGKPYAIEISTLGETMELTLSHEIGHFLEGVAIPGSKYGIRHWGSDELTKDWSAAVLASQEVRYLGLISQQGWVRLNSPAGSTANRPANPAYMAYLVSREELWARSYAQFITVRSGDPTLSRQLAARRSPAALLPLQWSDREFEPIASEFDRLFRKIGWVP